MATASVTDRITRISQQGWVNCYLVREDDGLTLVDALYGDQSARIRAAAEALGAPIVRIALTHSHPDHVGAVDALHSELGLEVLVAEREERLRRGDRTAAPGEPKPPKGNFKTSKVPATRTFSPGERIGSLEVVACPGHTPGHVAFLDTRDRTLIAGDAFKTLGGLSHTGRVHLGFPPVTVGTWDRPMARASAEQLAALEPQILCVGHGKPQHAAAARLRDAV
jgi:glyoxylase-like metal-dependent hydrolase (beta-lactamase superfamily II)